ncbi:MAG: hypothetical protein HC800_19055 [Phormidesmis sp. RL_2_1]|nr:hypothetical protein [Phormidesmis sp. RL_2_1]
MATPTSAKTNFWIICCEETEATQQISQAITDWQLPGVRSLVAHQLPLSVADAIAHADYAIFITPTTQPSTRISISPLPSAERALPKAHSAQSPTQSPTQSPAQSPNQSPAQLLGTIHGRHGQSPQSWLFKLPTTEVRATHVRPVPTQSSVAQALNQIEIFVRNYRLATAPKVAIAPKVMSQATA